MKAIMASTGGRAPPGKIRRRFAQDLTRLMQLADLALHRPHPLALVARQARPLPLIALGLPNPLP
jgi:hypothetical protein